MTMNRTFAGIAAAFSIAGAAVTYNLQEPQRDVIARAEKSVAQVHIGHGAGSAFLVDKRGYLLTCAHVAEASEEPITVRFENGKPIEAKLVGSLKDTDISVIKVEEKEVLGRPVLSFAASKPKIGDQVIEIGNPFNVGLTVTKGIISATNRSAEGVAKVSYIQFDAATNPGNSGGVVLSSKGQITGMADAIIAPRQAMGGIPQSAGIALAIPAKYLQAAFNYIMVADAPMMGPSLKNASFPIYRMPARQP